MADTNHDKSPLGQQKMLTSVTHNELTNTYNPNIEKMQRKNGPTLFHGFLTHFQPEKIPS